MSYGVEVRDAKGKVLASVQLSRELEAAFPGIDNPAYPVLRYLDEYGDTYFNPLQVAQLLKELDLLRSELADDDDAMSSLEALADIAQVALKLPHRQLVFIGD
jgi:hypothetical protein